MISTSAGNLTTEEEEQAAAGKAVTQGEFQGEWAALAPEFTATQPEVVDQSRAGTGALGSDSADPH